MSSDTPTSPEAVIRQLFMGLRASQVAYVAVKLALADQLANRPLTSTELAAAAGTDRASLRRVLRALVALGVLVEADTDLFALTSVGQLLRTDHPRSLRAVVLFMTGDVRWRCWGDLLESVRSGEPATQRVLGMSNFDFVAANPEFAEIHAAAMAAASVLFDSAICQAYDFSRFRRLVDVGGGSGQFIADILRANRELHGILFDLPEIVVHAHPILKAAGVADRCRIEAGSFFESVPGGGDGYVLKQIIHDWDDIRAVTILEACRKAMPADGRVLLVERLLPDHAAIGRETDVYFVDLEMLVMTPGGRERTDAEFRELFARAGLVLQQVVSTPSPFKILEGRAV